MKLIPESPGFGSRRERIVQPVLPKYEAADEINETLHDAPPEKQEPSALPGKQTVAASFNPDVSYPAPPPAQETDRSVASRRPSTTPAQAGKPESEGGGQSSLTRALIVGAAEAAYGELEAEQPAAPSYDPERELTNRFLLCRVHGETFAVPIGEILEILRERPLTPVPLTGVALAGVLSLRGRMVPVIDAALRLGFPAAVSDELTRIVVFEQNEEWIGLRVAGVGQVSTIAPDSLQHPGAALGEANAEMLSGVTRTNDGFVAVPVLARLLEVAR